MAGSASTSGRATRHSPGTTDATPELRAVAGNLLFSTGANEFAGRYTTGHFETPVMKTTNRLDNRPVVVDGREMDLA
jgi:hypothetical protein